MLINKQVNKCKQNLLTVMGVKDRNYFQNDKIFKNSLFTKKLTLKKKIYNKQAKKSSGVEGFFCFVFLGKYKQKC